MKVVSCDDVVTVEEELEEVEGDELEAKCFNLV